MRTVAAVLLGVAMASSAGGAGRSIPYQAGGETFEGYFVSPGPDAPLVFLVHDWDGLTDYEIKRAQMLAELGYAVFAADLFGAGVRPETTEEKQKLTGDLYGDREKMRHRLYAALDTARAEAGDAVPVVAIGYCFGGGAVLELARSGADLDGFVTFHGILRTPEGQDYSKAKGEFLILHGTADQSVSMDDFAELARELESAGIPHEMITYGGAPHAFTVFGAPSYREDADRKSWKRFTQFLERVLKEPKNPDGTLE
jgi:dienelactone hydrolase